MESPNLKKAIRSFIDGAREIEVAWKEARDLEDSKFLEFHSDVSSLMKDQFSFYGIKCGTTPEIYKFSLDLFVERIAKGE
jgi:hypothetical protein